MIDILEQLIGIPSFSREEDKAATWLQERLSAEGLDVHREGNNLWVESEPAGNKPTILLNAHIDTVHPSASWTKDPFRAERCGDVLYGLGSNDDGGSLVALLMAYKTLTATEQPYRLIYSVTAEEEVSGRNGIEAIVPLIGKIDLGIIGEPTGMRMAVAEKGLMVLDCTAHGKAGHAAREEGVNALYKAIADIEWLRGYRFEKVSPYCGEVKMSVTMISAGTQHNVVPDSCKFVVDVRGNGMYSNLEILDTVRAGIESECNPRSTRLNGSAIDTAHPVVQRGISLGLECFGSPTTSNQSVSAFTTLKIGPGESSRSHTADEYIKISEIENGAATYVALLDKLQL